MSAADATDTITVLCAVLGPAEAEVVRTLGAPRSGATVTRRCADLTELLASAEAGSGRTAVVSATLPGLGRDAVTRMHQAGVRVVALDDAPEPSTERLAAVGVDGVARSVEDLLGAVRDERSALSPKTPGAGEPAVGRTGKGRIVTVWGPVGAPGRTTTAIELAVALATDSGTVTGVGRGDRGRGDRLRGVRPWRGRPRRSARRGGRPLREAAREQVVLVDADTYGPCVGPRLGTLGDSAGLAGAVRAAGAGPLDVETLARYAPVTLPGVRVLGGLGRATRWAELSGAALDVVWERLRDLADWTVIDTGPVLETDELLSYDTRAPQRNAAALGALAAADVVVVVGGADPIGLQRLVRGLDDLAEVPAPLTPDRLVVVNRVRSATVGAQPRTAIRTALNRFAGVDPHLVPDDPAGLDAGLLSGRSLAECAPGSPARAAFGELADQVRRAVRTRASPGGRDTPDPATISEVSR
ncbi:P-loop NTPase [Myceligenerans cantabricum]